MIQTIQDQIISISDKVENGKINLLAALILFEELKKGLEDSLDMVKQFKYENQNEIDSQAKEYDGYYNGWKIELRNGGKTFDFKSIPEWQEAEKSKKSIEEKYKSMWIAKTNGNPRANVSEDGEELQLPEIKYRKSSVILKKVDR